MSPKTIKEPVFVAEEKIPIRITTKSEEWLNFLKKIPRGQALQTTRDEIGVTASSLSQTIDRLVDRGDLPSNYYVRQHVTKDGEHRIYIINSLSPHKRQVAKKTSSSTWDEGENVKSNPSNGNLWRRRLDARVGYVTVRGCDELFGVVHPALPAFFGGYPYTKLNSAGIVYWQYLQSSRLHEAGSIPATRTILVIVISRYLYKSLRVRSGVYASTFFCASLWIDERINLRSTFFDYKFSVFDFNHKRFTYLKRKTTVIDKVASKIDRMSPFRDGDFCFHLTHHFRHHRVYVSMEIHIFKVLHTRVYTKVCKCLYTRICRSIY